MQVFILPFAGGNQYSFEFMKQFITKEIDVQVLELPGRGGRVEEPNITNFKEAVADYHRQFVELYDGDRFIIYGHSMGALISLFLSNALEEQLIIPELLLVSGHPGPGIEKQTQKYLMTDQELKEELRSLGGISEEVLDHKELFNYYGPIIRADFEILEKEELPSVFTQVAIHALMGSEEKHISDIENWQQFTSGNFTHEILLGDHFFIHKYPELIANRIKIQKSAY